MTECSKELAPSTARSLDSEDVFGSNSSVYSDEYFYDDIDYPDNDDGGKMEGEEITSHPFQTSSKSSRQNTWEEWMVKKLADEQESLAKKKHEMELKALKELQIKTANEEKQKRCAEAHKQWVEEKNLKIRLKKENEKREKEVKKLLEEEKKAKKEIEAKKNFHKWKKTVLEKKQAQLIKEEQEKQKKQQLIEEKKKMSQESFENWLKSKSGQPIQRNTHSPPVPSYVNPAPWIAPTHDATRRNNGCKSADAACIPKTKSNTTTSTVLHRKDMSFSQCGRLRPHVVHFKRPKSATTTKRK